MTPLDLALAGLFFSLSIAAIVWGVRWWQRNKLRKALKSEAHSMAEYKRNVRNMRRASEEKSDD